jgi:tetratricopeptide (TPR) repeat protein
MNSSLILRLSFRIALVSALSCVCLPAQQAPAPAPAPAPASPGANSPGGNNAPGRGQQQPPGFPGRDQQQQQQQQPFPEMQRPVFLSGKVVMDDGTPPPDPVVIERVCGAVVRPEGYTDTKGRFSFQLGQNQGMMADASMSSASELGGPGMPSRGGGMTGGGMMGAGRGGFNERDLTGCELRATLPGFRSEVVNLSGRRSLDNPDVGVIILHRLAKVEGFTFSATTAYAPKDAKKAYEKGSQLIKKKKLDDAEKQLQKAVGSYPKFAAAWYELGTVYQQKNKLAEAKDAYQQSIKADEKYVNPYAQLARLAGAEAKWPETNEYAEKVIRLNPYFSPEIYYINAVANFNLSKYSEAEDNAREAAKQDSQHRNPRINHLLGVILAQKEAYPEAAENMRTFLKKVPEGPDAENVKKQLAEVERRMGNSATAQGKQAQ